MAGVNNEETNNLEENTYEVTQISDLKLRISKKRKATEPSADENRRMPKPKLLSQTSSFYKLKITPTKFMCHSNNNNPAEIDLLRRMLKPGPNCWIIRGGEKSEKIWSAPSNIDQQNDNSETPVTTSRYKVQVRNIYQITKLPDV